MLHFLREVATLREEGKLHSRLLTRTRLYLGISLLLFGVAVYYIYFGANPFLSLGLAVFGFVIGFYIFSRITPVQWNTKTEQIESSSLGSLAYVMIGLYIVFEIGARTILGSLLGVSSEGYVLALIFGVILGRTIGIVAEIHRVYTKTHTA